MNKIRKQILDEWKEHPYLYFANHPDMKALCVCSGDIGEDDEVDFDEIIFAVPTEWRFGVVAREFEIKDVQYWLENEYTSDESYIIFQMAMEQNQIMMLEFN